ncbi:trichohyalin-like, partial [Temnothorax curvispinosus]|uniref:Trichohyalin-like n=1 Tax=Temnothorax curvispinosus TaxID=300111 RepID=A0A6J1RMY8_9HYME
MDRQQLEKLSVSELQDEAKKYGLNPPNDTSRCIDMIMSYLERQATSDLQKRETRAATKSKAMQSTVAATTPTESSDLSQICAWMAQQMRIQQEDKQEQRRLQQEQMRIQQEDKQEQRRLQQEQMRFQQEQMRIQQEDKQEQRRIQQEQTLIQQEFQREQARNQQEQQRQNQAMMQQMVELTNLSRENSQNGIRNITSEDNVIRADPDSSITRRQPISSVATAHAVKLLTTQIPEFAGTEEEKIEIWIQTGERIAQIHAVSDDVLLLAASSKLVKNAKRWFDLNVTTLIESWQIFKEAIIRRFKRKILFHVAMQKVE